MKQMEPAAPATMLFSMCVGVQDAEAAAIEMRALNAVMRSQPGFRHLDVLRRDEAGCVEFSMLVHFADEASLQAWKATPERLAAIARIEAFARGAPRREEALGNDPWFNPMPAPPGPMRPPAVPLWKRWVLSILAVYPGLVLLLLISEPLLFGVPWLVRIFIVVVIMTGLMAAWIVPFLTRLLQGWLTSGASPR
jgi:antibiotic biosynthesis monooxygenase (ABM) superfamily enzyme